MHRWMKLPACLACALLVAIPIPSQAQQMQNGITTLANLRDQARPLLIFAPAPNDPQLEIQLRTLTEHAADVYDRQIVPIALPYQNPSTTSVQLSPNEAEAARRRFHVNPTEFTVILIGKDGGAKLRSFKPLSIQKLDETIDAMPMRQQEMKAAQPGG